MSKKHEEQEQDLAERERIEREKAAEEKKRHLASKGEPATETEPEGKYHGYSPAQIERIKAEVDPPDAVPTEESAAVPPNPEPEQPPPEPEQPPPEPPARGRAA